MIQTPSVGIFFLLVFKFPITFSYYSETKCCWKRYFFFGIDMNLVGMAQKRGLLLFCFFLFRYRFSKRKFSNNECETGDCSKISLDLLFFSLDKNWKFTLKIRCFVWQFVSSFMFYWFNGTQNLCPVRWFWYYAFWVGRFFCILLARHQVALVAKKGYRNMVKKRKKKICCVI